MSNILALQRIVCKTEVGMGYQSITSSWSKCCDDPIG
jgi:hypothetical protein